VQKLRIYVLIALTGAVASAQDLGRLSGSVVDPTQAVVPGARVELYLPGGSAAVLATETTGSGLFSFVSVRADYYDLFVEAAGFKKYAARRVKVDPGRETSLPPIQLELGPVSDSIEVTVGATGVQTANAEISTTIANEQVSRLPVFDRSPLQLILTQPGIHTGRSFTTINGLRTSYANVTLDGINIQDNFLRDNALDFLPNLLKTDQVAEMTVITSNANATYSGGAAQVSFITPSGSNEFHGGGFWANRNNKFSANEWFNNRDGIARPRLNLNYIGGRIGGPVIKDKLLFYSTYEAHRLKEQSTANRTILTATARQGVFTYPNFAGTLLTANVLTLRGVPIDPYIGQLLAQVPGPERINNFRAGDSAEGRLRNTAGYSFLVRDNRTQDSYTGKLDWIRSAKQTVYGTFAFNRDIVDRPDESNDYSTVPKVTNDDNKHFLSVGWRWNPTPAVTTEVRGGFNLAPANFRTTEQFPPFLLAGLSFSNPINVSESQGRNTDTYSLQANSAYVTGRHNIQFGYQQQLVRLKLFFDDGINPVFTIGMGTRNPSLAASQFPGIGATDLAAANQLLATLGGYFSGFQQLFNATSRTSGFVPGASYIRNYTLDNYAFYVQDSWRVRRGLAVTLGLRYDYFTPVDERNGMALFPIIQFNDPVRTLLSDSILDFAGSSVGRPFYNRDKNNFAPNVGVAWDPFGTSKTSVRAAYSVFYVNDQHVASLFNSTNTNDGLATGIAATGLAGRISVNRPQIPVPDFLIPRRFSDNNAEDPFSAFALPDPNLRNPYVQNWSIGVQHEYRGMVFDLRYVGNHTTKAFRAFDYNQVIIRENGFLDDFRRAVNNGNLAQARTGVFNPAFNASIPGSQPLPVFGRLDEGGLITNPIVVNFIRSGQVGELAAVYKVNGFTGVDFFRNPFALGTNLMTNFSHANYNALQFDVQRRIARGLRFQANYTWSKVLSDSTGDNQVRFEPFLDRENPSIERARANFDITHVIKGNFVYDLPFGPGHRLNLRPIGRVLGGWSISGLVTKQSGTPFSILSGRGTFNRTARSFGNTAITPLTKPQLDEIIGFQMTGNGPIMISRSVVGSDGRAVAADGAAPFAGQVFFHPPAGDVGTLQRRMFSGPWIFDFDFGLHKDTRIGERHTVILQAYAYNLLNHPTFFIGDQALDSVNFGQIRSTFTVRRQMQFGLWWRF
jgi:hypothetical protein